MGFIQPYCTDPVTIDGGSNGQHSTTAWVSCTISHGKTGIGRSTLSNRSIEVAPLMRLPPSVRVDSIKAIAPGFLRGTDDQEIVTFHVSGFVPGMEVSINAMLPFK